MLTFDSELRIHSAAARRSRSGTCRRRTPTATASSTSRRRRCCTWATTSSTRSSPSSTSRAAAPPADISRRSTRSSRACRPNVVVIPGHGEVTDLAGLKAFRQYIADVVDAAAKAKAAGKSEGRLPEGRRSAGLQGLQAATRTGSRTTRRRRTTRADRPADGSGRRRGDGARRARPDRLLRVRDAPRGAALERHQVGALSVGARVPGAADPGAGALGPGLAVRAVAARWRAASFRPAGCRSGTRIRTAACRSWATRSRRSPRRSNAPVLLFGVARGWNLSLLARILLAAGGAFAWLSDLGRSRISASLGALMFALSGRLRRLARASAGVDGRRGAAAAPLRAALRPAARPAPRPRGSRPRRFSCSPAGIRRRRLMVALARGRRRRGQRGGPPRVALVRRRRRARRSVSRAPLLLPFAEYFRAERRAHGRRPASPSFCPAAICCDS